MLLCLCITGCFGEKPYSPLSKDLYSKNFITVQSFEKAFKTDGINLVYKGDDKSSGFLFLQKKHCKIYYIDNSDVNQLYTFTFSSSSQREKARLEYNQSTAAANLSYREIYEAKNIMVILIVRDQTIDYYTKVKAVMEKLKL